MPQLPTSTAEEYGAEDEIKQYNQEEDECSDTSTVDVVNDIKDDLLNEDGRDSVKGGDDSIYHAHSSANRYSKGDSTQGLYGSPAAVIVGPHVSERYYDQPSSYRSGTNHPHPHNAYTSGTQIRMPMYSREDRPYYEHGPWPSQVPIPPHYAMHCGIPQKYGYRLPSGIPPGMPYYGPGGHVYAGMSGRPAKEPKRPHVKKPLNAFMLFMKEQRPKIAAEFTLKESAAINQILGKRWHNLDKAEQSKYYEMARKERALHMQLYPGWSARDNYGQIGRKKKRPRDKNEGLQRFIQKLIEWKNNWHALDKSEQAKYYEMARKERALHMQLYPGWSARDNYAQIGRKKKRPRDKNEEMNPKKCRARYGLDRQEQWCKPCRRKKKCIRFIIGADGETTEIIVKEQDPSDSDDNENRVPSSGELESKEGLKELVNNNEILKLSSSNNNNNNSSETSTHASHISDTSTSTSSTTPSQTSKEQIGVYSSSVESVITCASSLSASSPSSNAASRITYTTNGHTLTDLRTSDTKPVDFSRL